MFNAVKIWFKIASQSKTVRVSVPLSVKGHAKM
ncbi:hypothetical protein LLT3_08805 [Lactococcus cremoris subsp. cremoris TIFN3]|uniref:Uncharacterized protein n=1 Tax=Lactococcus cremoris subsp. cremoris TIFN3 TaxID=1234873 RepID=T0WQJ6_LACLC|nr:hypothetical protein LLT3_08805 [Lactococcus cremoris subsp. cremoris TIFN3]